MTFPRFFLILPVFALGGCLTLGSIKENIVQGYNSVAGYIEKKIDPIKEGKRNLPLYDGTCPTVSVRPDLVYLVDFYNDGKPTKDNIVSEVRMTGIRNVCRIENNALVMQIDFDMKGKTGPRARAKPKDQPNFAYPYFVAVTDAQGNILSKEIFAATIAYGREENQKTLTETIFQNMPFPDSSAGEIYRVVVGFQLNDTQLAYNSQNPVVVPAPQNN